ncbi:MULTISPECIES: CPBP family intramembrane glutamic endopeptidase [Pseudonocardia]|uniref:CAAX amino terminal protease self-immunity n=2 Tax=Pseudonocardia TaxID=1847 RepID=A0A1Y2MZY4_PSEAH|nr:MULTISPECIES: CPBP family intramembrane glutamic endopeptidase [Pseudonocardia]OSY40773.1 CAAX amino terminal protease self- immunity [Pseudonocardia autotrophica]TDN71920.1 CAAX prenyl protease-like protein [Pseudonocardia autotrophica]BBG02607.1 CAAX amino protease [Pseudonocardia autotrophica]GEC24666.1 CAAX amino protease [Pseudonocardia saturnea]
MVISTDNPSRSRGATGLAGAIRRSPLLSFFLLANLMSWVAWTPYILSENGLGVWIYRFPDVLGTSQILGVLPGAYLGPIASAFLVTAIADGRPGLRRWIGRMWRWRVRRHWYALTLLGVPVAMLVTGFVFSGGRIVMPSLLVVAVYVPALLIQMITTGLAEEPGWRDFALPRLQRRFGPLAGTMVLGPLWALWHMPLFVTDWGGWPDADWTRPAAFVLFCLTFNIVMTWVFNRTGESLPLAMLLHVSVNNFASVVWSEMFPALDANRSMQAMAAGSLVVAVVVLVGTRGRLGYDHRNPAAPV